MADSIQRITSVLQSARDLTIGAAAVASSRIGESSYTQYSKSIDPEALTRLLSSRNPREVKDAMKRVMSVMASNDPTVELNSIFADVLKNITSEDVKVKRMVCIYLLRFAESDPNLALLSVNTIQKGLHDRDPQIRALALKVLSDINVSSLYPITLQSVRKCVSDASALVRATSAMAIYKLLQDAKSNDDEVDVRKHDLLPLFQELMADPDPLVISCSLVILQNCLPDRLDLLHGHFRRYCTILASLSHWAQPLLVEVLTQYSRAFISRPVFINKEDQSVFLLPELPKPLDPSFLQANDFVADADLDLFLNSLKTLLFSSNASVIISVSKALFFLAPLSKFKEFGIPHCLVKTFQLASVENRCVILQMIAYYASVDPQSFVPLYRNFLLSSNDDPTVGQFKLKIISQLITNKNDMDIVRELKSYITTYREPGIVKRALNTLVICAHNSNALSNHIMKWLLEFMESEKLNDSEVTSEYVNVIRHLIQINPSKNLHVMLKLSQIITETDNLSGYAKAGIIWLFGEYIHIEPRVVPDVLRKLIPKFADETKEARLQVLILAAKLLSFDIDRSESNYDFEHSRIAHLYDAVLYLAKFDDDFDIRDKARSLSSLFSHERFEILTLLLQAPKPWPAVSLFSYENKESDFAHLDLSTEILDSMRVAEWATEAPEVDRTPVVTNDFMKNKSSISSSTFFNSRTRSTKTSQKAPSPKSSHSPSPELKTFTSSKGKTYKLQSLDEFFADIPEKQKKSKIVVEEESETDSEEDLLEESSSDETNSSDEGEEESDSSSPRS
ncbi:unnamed protein product [Kluyveromyces dobzhanskii CBS 2104]|uniref:WGS project CCBQ000000000 data, contig 00107 n=1 Tax=Kluyveromyces dobzhanskii CBS 2104 TaxID=1427455 RepID=A0A0A8L107_9SACH|nr:unnamed protein product [Kluyveromyces dobzhanskii CBS 2104]